MASRKRTPKPTTKKRDRSRKKATPQGTQLLPGVVEAEEAERIEVLDRAGLDFADKRDVWQANGKKLSKAKEKLLGLMKEHGRTHYFNPEASVRIKIEHGEDKLSVLIGEKALGNQPAP